MELRRTLRVNGMTCANCARIVEKALSKIDGVKFAAVNLATNTAFVVLDKEVPFERFVEAVRSVGYDASFPDQSYGDETARLKRSKKNMLVATLLTTFLMTLMFSGLSFRYMHLTETILVALVLFYAGRDTLRGAWIALAHKHFNMDTLILFGSVTAWLTSVLHVLGFGVEPFGTIGAMIVSLHLIGRFLESNLRDKATKQVKELVGMQSREARIVTEHGEFTVPIDAVKEGLTVLVKTGERVPADGVVIEGQSLVDESMISGEPVPVPKRVGDEVTGGSLNLTGVLKVRVTKAGEDSFLARMVALVQEAQGAKIPIQALADKITNWFVPFIIVLAFLSSAVWFIWFDSLQSVTEKFNFLPWYTHVQDRLSLAVFVFLSVIVIACPCALGLATPMALVVGTSVAMRRGLLIKNAEVIQTTTEVGYVLFDKTGTLTFGKPAVIASSLPEESQSIVRAAVSRSNHPLARAVLEHLDSTTRTSKNGSEEIALDLFEELPGLGIRIVLKDQEYFVGKPADISQYSRYTNDGCSIVEVRREDIVLGFFAIRDTVREDSTEAVRKLKQLGITPVIVTGDNEEAARYVAGVVGVEKVFANTKPEEKMNIVRNFQSTGKKVIMVGDGINDAAALKAADIGIAIGSGTDIAIDSADVILVRGGISRVVEAVEISKRTFRKIKENLLFAFFYNALAIPMAMLGLLHPAIAEAAMALSSITVISNSLRLSKIGR